MATQSRPPRDPRASAPAAPRDRHDGWTSDKQARFIDALSQSACVEEACRSVGMSRQSAYALRSRPDAQAFRVAWEAAIDLGVRALTDAVISRALHGEAVPHFYQGQQVGEHRRYDNRLAMFILRYRDPLRYAATLDQMVYKGHPENAAVALLKAHNRMMDDAHDQLDLSEPIDEDAPRPGAPPWSTTPIVEERHAQAEQEIIASTAPIYGDIERRRRLQEARADHWVRERDAKRHAEEAKAAAAPPADLPQAPAPEPTAMPPRAAPAGGASGGDVVSTSSTYPASQPLPDPSILPPTPAWMQARDGPGPRPSVRRLD